MKTLKIAVDCDDVLVASTERIVTLYNQRFNTFIPLENSRDGTYPAWKASPEEIAERIYDIQASCDYGATKPFEDAVEVCKRLSDSGHELYIVTARAERLLPITTQMINNYFSDIFVDLVHLGIFGDKGEVCKRLAVDVLIDDSYTNISSALGAGIKHLLWFGDYPWSADIPDLPSGIKRCHDWGAVEEEVKRIAAQSF